VTELLVGTKKGLFVLEGEPGGNKAGQTIETRRSRHPSKGNQ
jgi:hypothetical protein